MLEPRFVALDTSSWVKLARYNSSFDAKRVLKVFESGVLVPFFTSFHLEELARDKNDTVFRERVNLIRRLPYVVFPKLPHPVGNVGNTIDAREWEMRVLLDIPKAAHDLVIKQTQPHITNGFCSGKEFCQSNEEWWMHYRENIATYTLAHSADVASLSHFRDPILSADARLPKSSKGLKLRPKEEVKQLLMKRYKSFVAELKRDGDKRLLDPDQRLKSPEQMATSFLNEVYQDSLPLYDMPGDFLENLLALSGIERARLPANATVADVGYEAVFVSSFAVHERRLKLPPGSLRQFVEQEFVPSWIVWREVNRAIVKLKKAEGSSLNDNMIVPFALYIDAVEVDKRIWDCVQRSARKHLLMQKVQKRVFRTQNLCDLANKLECLATAS